MFSNYDFNFNLGYLIATAKIKTIGFGKNNKIDRGPYSPVIFAQHFQNMYLGNPNIMLVISPDTPLNKLDELSALFPPHIILYKLSKDMVEKTMPYLFNRNVLNLIMTNLDKEAAEIVLNHLPYTNVSELGCASLNSETAEMIRAHFPGQITCLGLQSLQEEAARKIASSLEYSNVDRFGLARMDEQAVRSVVQYLLHSKVNTFSCTLLSKESMQVIADCLPKTNIRSLYLHDLKGNALDPLVDLFRKVSNTGLDSLFFHNIEEHKIYEVCLTLKQHTCPPEIKVAKDILLSPFTLQVIGELQQKRNQALAEKNQPAKRKNDGEELEFQAAQKKQRTEDAIIEEMPYWLRGEPNMHSMKTNFMFFASTMAGSKPSESFTAPANNVTQKPY